MNRRLFVFGIGVGIIVGAGLLQFMLIGERQADALTNDSAAKTYTQAELDQAVADERERVQAELAKLGAGAADRTAAEPGKADDQTTDPATPVQSDRKTDPIDSATPSSGEAASDSSGSAPQADNADKSADKPESGAAGEAADAEPARVIVRIPPNASVADTAGLLAARGIISDKQAFIDLMRKRTIRAGYFAFQGKLSLQQVRVIITSKPLDPAAARMELEASGE